MQSRLHPVSQLQLFASCSVDRGDGIILSGACMAFLDDQRLTTTA